MPRYGCLGLTESELPLLGMMVLAEDPITAEQVARQLWRRVPGIESVEVWLDHRRVYPQSAGLKATG